MNNYYFLVPSLPPLSLEEKPEIAFEELVARMETELTKSDLEKTKILRRFVDVNNIRALLMEEPIDPFGNLTEKDLDEALLVGSGLPEYVFEFLGQFERTTDKIQHFSGLLARYFQEEISAVAPGFLKNYLRFERESRLVLVALRAKLIRRDVAKELQFEDPSDVFIAQILAQKDANRYEPPVEYVDLRDLLATCYADPLLENRIFTEYRFKKIEELAEGQLFSVDRILSYMAQLMLVEHLHELNEEKGKLVLDTFDLFRN